MPPEDLDSDEHYQERAAICEFEGGLRRDAAEAFARMLNEQYRRRRDAHRDPPRDPGPGPVPPLPPLTDEGRKLRGREALRHLKGAIR